MRRAQSFTETDQGNEQTCSLHMVSRLFVHNIVKPDICPLEYRGEIIPPNRDTEFTSECSFLLETEITNDLSLLNPDICGGIRKYFSTLMYLYAYYSILEKVPHVVCNGSSDIENLGILNKCIYDQDVPAVFSDIQVHDIHIILDTLPKMYASLFQVLPPPKKSSQAPILNGIDGYRSRLFMQLCTNNDLYIGVLLSKKKGKGHSLIISHFEDDVVTFKNSWGQGTDDVPLKQLRGPHYQLSAVDNFRDTVVDMNTPVDRLYYLGTRPLAQLYHDVGKKLEDLSPPHLREVTRRSARRVGKTRTSHIKASSTQNRRSRVSA